MRPGSFCETKIEFPLELHDGAAFLCEFSRYRKGRSPRDANESYSSTSQRRCLSPLPSEPPAVESKKPIRRRRNSQLRGLPELQTCEVRPFGSPVRSIRFILSQTISFAKQQVARQLYVLWRTALAQSMPIGPRLSQAMGERIVCRCVLRSTGAFRLQLVARCRGGDEIVESLSRCARGSRRSSIRDSAQYLRQSMRQADVAQFA